MNCDGLRKSPEEHRLDADDGQYTSDDQCMLREKDRTDFDIREKKDQGRQPAQGGQHETGIKEQTFRTEKKIEAKAAPAVAPAPEMWWPFPAVRP